MRAYVKVRTCIDVCTFLCAFLHVRGCMRVRAFVCLHLHACMSELQQMRENMPAVAVVQNSCACMHVHVQIRPVFTS
jgi:hypothetical protein